MFGVSLGSLGELMGPLSGLAVALRALGKAFGVLWGRGGWLYFTNEEDSKEDGATRKPGCMAGDGGRDGVQQPKREICKKIVVLGALSPPPKKKEKKKEK